MTHAYADGSNLAFVDPDTGKPFAPRRGDSVLRSEDSMSNCSIQRKYLCKSCPQSAQIDDRIAHQLTGPMICGLAAAIDGKKGCGKCAAPSRLRLVRRAANRVNRFVLQ